MSVRALTAQIVQICISFAPLNRTGSAALKRRLERSVRCHGPCLRRRSASRSALVNTGSAMLITVDRDDVVVVIGHLPDPAETRKAGPAVGPSDTESPHRESAWVITQGHGGEHDRSPCRLFIPC